MITGEVKIKREKIINNAERLVIKVGSSLLLTSKGPNFPFIEELIDEIAHLKRENREVILVSSGAIGLGKRKLKIENDSGVLPSKQALASVGQTQLMNLYSEFFQKYKLYTGQVLLSAQDLSRRSTYLNARNTLLALLKFGVVPVVNENDTVAVEEIKFGDNDTLSALVAGLVDADLLIIISDIKGLYTSDPKKNSQAKLLPEISLITKQIEKMAQGSCVEGRVGGMKTKINAAKIATRSGIPVILGGDKEKFLGRLFSGESLGTLFSSPVHRLASRKKWIAYGTRSGGKIVVDNGAKKALIEEGGSLLPVGIKQVQGRFQAGDSVSLLDENNLEFARGIVYYSSKELERIKGVKSSFIEELLGYKYFDEVIHRDNLVIL